MLRRVGAIVAVALLAALAVASFAYYQFQRTETKRLDDRLYVVLGGGGNSSILLSEAGALVVDTKFLRPGWRLASIVRSLTDKPVQVIINTHYHRDHTHGNPNYPIGTRVIAQRRTRAHLIALDKRFWEVEPAWSLLPQELVDDATELEWGDEKIRVSYLGRGHTDGDVVVHFTKRRLLQTGDLFVHGMYPRVDLKGGGSAREWLGTLDKILAIEGVDKYIPGHGELAERKDVERLRAYLGSLVEQVEKHAAAGKSLREIQGLVDLKAYDDFRGLLFFTSRSKNVASVYEEISGHPQPQPQPTPRPSPSTAEAEGMG